MLNLSIDTQISDFPDYIEKIEIMIHDHLIWKKKNQWNKNKPKKLLIAFGFN